ncbi:hypothetical protein GIB67_013980 [Kingdonia uniflora]|uniref:Uncharacterized protein n=1 Tax=Kingdonia uniflora TaxID=39325 RepID=A0A7J7LDI4_9MAGN|nr:hypothetical protein GIB67_013980 [Kingdonia uniflora]
MWEYNRVVRGKLESIANSHPDTEGVKSTVERKESLLDEVVEEETELKLVLRELGLSRKKRIESRSKKVAKAQSTRFMKGVNEGKSGKVTQGKRKRVEPLGGSGEKVTEGRSASVDHLKEVEERARLAILQGKEDTSQMESELKKVESKLEKNLVGAKTEALKEVKQLKASHTVAIGQLQVETKANLDEMVEERDRLGCHLMLKGCSQEKVDAIKDDTYAEVEEEEAEVVREMSLRINDLESGLARERKTSKALLSAQVELQVELDASRVREDHALMCNREFVEQFDRIKEANENREDQYVKVQFRLKKLNQVISNLTRPVEEKDSRIKKGLRDLSKATEHAENLQRQVDSLAVKGKQANMAQYRIWALERTEELCRSDLNRCRIDLECDDLNERVARLKAERDQAIARAKKSEARECSGGSKTGNVQKGNANLRECQHKLDVALIREKVLEGEIRAKDLLVKRKDELLKDLPVREELNTEIMKLRARVVELKAINLAELVKYIAKFEADIIYHDRVDIDIITWKDTCAMIKACLERLKARFVTSIIPDVSRSVLLSVIVAYFVEEVKRLESK